MNKGNRWISYNTEFFRKPNIESSYWAGFIAADGCVRYRENTVELRIGLSQKDKPHLIKFSKEISYKGIVHDYENKDGPYSVLCLGSAFEIAEDLKEHYNIVPNKSLNLQPPNLDADFVLPFIIGYIDGDGSIWQDKKNNRLCISMVGTQEVLEWIRRELSLLPGKYSSKERVHKYGSTAQYALRGRRALEVFDQISSIPVPKLSRKWNIKYECSILHHS